MKKLIIVMGVLFSILTCNISCTSHQNENAEKSEIDTTIVDTLQIDTLDYDTANTLIDTIYIK